MKTLLAIDIGNTNVSFASVKGKEIIKRSCVSTSLPQKQFKDTIAQQIVQAKRKGTSESIVCSVAPKTLNCVKSFIRRELGSEPLIVGKNIKVPLISRYHKKQIGQDRLVCAYAAQELYGKPLIVIDLGTAVTCDYISKKGDYEGGIIVPGLRLSAESLFKKTALLPDVNIERPAKLIGQDTKTSILSGIFYGYGALLDGIIARIHRQKKNRAKVILTGGYARLMKSYMDHKVHKIDEDLVFKGLRLLADNS
ncbi:MAG: type III pantothenate kinase [Candidatus Aceula meridiana]|nr:type III pantothenate kinase [Candidatus Aceula meridiana]